MRGKTARGVVWSVTGMLSTNVLQFASSLVLTRLLFPEAFGVVATSWILFTALELFSDLGLVQAIVQHRRGEEARYLNTAWTLQIVRGILLAGVSAAAAYPFASFYREPILAPVILVMAAGSVLRGFGSPALFVLKRRLEVRRLTIMELACNAIRITATIAAALVLRNVWALVVGSLFGRLTSLIASYMVWPYRPRLHVDSTAAREMLRFGRFILFSGILGFLTLRLDTLLIPRYLGMGPAGVYSIAVTIAMMPTMLMNTVVASTLYPAFCQLKDDAERLKARQREVLRIYCGLAVPLVLLVAVNAETLIRLMYDPRYASAGAALRWLLVAVTIQGGARLINTPIMATGRSYVGTVASVGFLLALCVALPLLASRWQMQGYAAAKMLGSFGLLLPLLWFTCRLGHNSVGELIGYLRAPFMAGTLLLGIAVVCDHYDNQAGLIGPIARVSSSTLAVALLLLGERRLLLGTMQEFVRLVPALGGRFGKNSARAEQVT